MDYGKKKNIATVFVVRNQKTLRFVRLHVGSIELKISISAVLLLPRVMVNNEFVKL